MKQVLSAVLDLIFTIGDEHSGKVEIQIVYWLDKIFWVRYFVLTVNESFKVLKHLQRKLFYLHLLIEGDFLTKYAMQDGDVGFDKGYTKA